MYDMFLLEQEFRNNSPVTISWYKDQLEEFFIWLMDNIPKAYNDPAQLNLLNFKRYGVHLKQQTKRNGDRLSSSSVHGSLRAVKAFYNFCIGEDYLEDFSRQLRLPKVHCKEQLILDDQEIIKLLRACDDSFSHYSLRNKCFVLLMLDSGLRRGEIPRINMGDITFSSKSMIIRGKGSKQRLIPIGYQTCEQLLNYCLKYRHGASGSEPFFVDQSGGRCSDNLIKQIFKRLKDTTGIERLHPHLLRHTFATHALNGGMDVTVIQRLLGHEDIATTQIYAELNEEGVRHQYNKYVAN